jgi:hypothetical protein
MEAVDLAGAPGHRDPPPLGEEGWMVTLLSFRDVRLFKDENADLLLRQMRLFAREIMPSFRA